MRPMPFRPTHSFIISLLILVSGSHVVMGHDLFLRTKSYQAKPESPTKVIVLNGSFAESINSLSASIVEEILSRGAADVASLPQSSWEETKSETSFWRRFLESNSMNLKHTNSFEAEFPAEGTWSLGVTLHPSRIAMEPQEFLEYLKTEAYCEINLADYGIIDEDDLVRERYIKNAKTIIQVGNSHSEHVTRPLNQNAEIVPLTNPLDAKPGDILKFKILVDGEIVEGQNVAAGRQQESDEKTDGDRVILTSNNSGIIELPISQPAVYWLKFIHLRPAPAEDNMDFNSYWGSLTFEIN